MLLIASARGHECRAEMPSAINPARVMQLLWLGLDVDVCLILSGK
jgi:hypothetical protein